MSRYLCGGSSPVIISTVYQLVCESPEDSSLNILFSHYLYSFEKRRQKYSLQIIYLFIFILSCVSSEAALQSCSSSGLHKFSLGLKLLRGFIGVSVMLMYFDWELVPPSDRPNKVQLYKPVIASHLPAVCPKIPS